MSPISIVFYAANSSPFRRGLASSERWGGILKYADLAVFRFDRVRTQGAAMQKKYPAGSRAELKKLAGLLNDTRGFSLIFALVAAAGSILAWVDQGQDLLRSVTDVNRDHTSGFSWQVFWLCASVFALGFQGWFWGRTIADGNRGEAIGGLKAFKEFYEELHELRVVNAADAAPFTPQIAYRHVGHAVWLRDNQVSSDPGWRARLASSLALLSPRSFRRDHSMMAYMAALTAPP